MPALHDRELEFGAISSKHAALRLHFNSDSTAERLCCTLKFSVNGSCLPSGGIPMQLLCLLDIVACMHVFTVHSCAPAILSCKMSHTADLSLSCSACQMAMSAARECSRVQRGQRCAASCNCESATQQVGLHARLDGCSHAAS